MSADQLPLGMDLVGSDVTFIGCNAYFLIDSGEFEEFLDVSVHRLVGVVRQGLVIVERNILVFLQNGLCEVVKLDGYTIAVLTVVTSIWSPLMSLLRRLLASE